MREKIFSISGILLITLLLFPFLLYSKKKTELPPKYKKWIEEEVVYIITPKEREVFYQLETDAQRDRFIEEFWRQRDPTPGTPRNEFKEEHYRRIEYANKWFGRGTPIPGWKTDRGRVYIILGEPIFRQTFSDPPNIPYRALVLSRRKRPCPLFLCHILQKIWHRRLCALQPIKRWTKKFITRNIS